MSMEKLQTLYLSPPSSSTSIPLHLRIQQTLASCSQSIEIGDFNQSEASISELIEFLNSVSDSVALVPENEELQQEAFELLSEIHRGITSPSLDQAVIDALSFELPKAVARFSSVSKKCLGIVESIVNRFVETCSPRDMVSVLCEENGKVSLSFCGFGLPNPTILADFESTLDHIIVQFARYAI